MNLQEILHKVVSALEDKRSFVALASWPKFSLESFLVTSRLRRFGINPLTILDVGANVGQFAIAARKTWPAAYVYSFEPSPEVAARLRSNIAKLGRMSVVEIALGEFAGVADFNINRRDQASSILPQSMRRNEIFPEETISQIIQVKVCTLDEALASCEVTGPVLLKIDAQGFEDRVLKGALNSLKKIEFVLLEASMNSLYEGELSFVEMLSLMDKMGFEFVRPLSWHLAPRTGEIIEMDILFANRNLETAHHGK